MSELEALLLGIVQGLTEFLPISSSGHLIIVPWLQEYTYLQENEEFHRTFDVAIHAGTLIAVVTYFRKDLLGMARGFLSSLRTRSVETLDQRMAWLVVVGTIPAVIVGGLGEDFIDENLGEPWMIAIMLIVFGLALGAADRMPQRRSVEKARVRDGIWVGLAQACALMPGISRSGITITASRILGFDRDSAARVAFLLLVPVTAGAVLFKGYGATTEGLPDDVAGPLIVGTLAAGITGYAAIAGTLAYVRKRSYDGFVIYRLFAGVAILTLIATGVRDATF